MIQISTKIITIYPNKTARKGNIPFIKQYNSKTEVYDGYTNKLKTWNDVVKWNVQKKLHSRIIVKVKKINNGIEYKSRRAVAKREIRKIVANPGFDLRVYQT
jgi:hypothetical protein